MQRLKLYANNWIFGNASLEEVAKRVSKIGFDGIELVGEPELYNGNEVNKIMKEYGLKVCSLCGMFPGPGENNLRALCHPDKNERVKAIDYVKQCVDLAKETEARSILVVPSLVGSPVLFSSKENDWKRAAESISLAGEYAEKNKVFLTIEPINRYEVSLVYGINDAVKMCKEINNQYVRTMGDTFHMQMEEGDGIANAIRRNGSYWIQHLHIADNTREAPGLGTMPWRDIIRSLYDINYEGAISFEPLPKGKAPYDARNGNIPAEKLDSELAIGLAYLKNQEEIVQKSLL